MTHLCNRRVPRGFTLIEVLAAIALLALVFAAGLGALGRAVHNAETAAALNTAVERAQSLVATQGLTAPLRNQTLSGRFTDGKDWTLKIQKLPTTTTVELYQIDVAVQYGTRRILRLSTERVQVAP